MLLLDETIRFIDCNAAALQILGATDRNEIISRSPAELSPVYQSNGQTSIVKAEQMIRLAYAEGSARFEWIHTRMDGTPIEMDISLTVIPVETKHILLVHWRDITQRKQIERSQRAVYQISEAAQTADNLNSLFASLHVILSELMPANNFYIAIVDHTTGMITFPFHKDEHDNEWNPILPGKSITGYILKTGTSLLATPEIFKALIDSGEVELLGTQSVDWLGVPLKTQTDEVFGVMALQTYSKSIRFTPADQELLEFISKQVSIAIRRKQMEDTFRESERSYLGLFNSVTDAIYIQDEQGRFIDVNDSVLTMYGYTKEELIGKTPEFLSAPGMNNLSEIIEKVKRTFATGEPIPFEFWGLRKNGAVFPKDVIISKGKYFGKDVIIASARDITERKRAEETIRISELQYADLLESLLDGVYKSTHDGKFLEVNMGMVKMLGYSSKDELLAVDIKRDLYFDAVEREIVTEDELHGKIVTYRLKKKDGSELWVEDHGRYVFDHDGTIVFHEGIIRDVTARKRAEDELRIASTVYQAVSEAIVVTDATNTIIAINPAFTKLTGYSRDEVLGKTPALFKSGKHSAEFYKKMWDSINRYGTWQGEIVNKRKNGELYDEWLSISSIHNEHGDVIQHVALFSDITEQKKIQEHLLQTQKLESLGTLAGGIAHDFNNLLAILLGSAEILKKRLKEDPKLLIFINQIIEASHRGESISKQLLFFSRQSDVILEPISLTHIIEEVKTMLRHFIPKTISVNTDISLTNGIINGDAGHLQQIILNLCLNAKDAIGDHGSITIRERSVDASVVRKKFSNDVEGDYVTVEVIDTGSGIDPLNITKIYDPFFTTKEKGKGTGLGLSIVSGLVRSHHGFIDVTSTKGVGTTFTLYFPSAMEGIEIVPQYDHEFLFRGETILIVDDEDTLRNSLRELLEHSGCKVLQATDGFEGIEVYQQQRNIIDVVISDLGMPNLNGEEMFTKLKEINPDVKVIISSGYLDGSIRSQMIKNGIKDVITKPYLFSQIAEILNRVLYS